MTELQKKIQKSSYAAALAFYIMVMYPVGHFLNNLLRLFQLLTGKAQVDWIFHNVPHISITTATAFLLSNCAVYLMASAALIMAQRIFREISKEYTPFKRLHVTRLRRITLLSTFCIIGDGLLKTWTAQLSNDPLQPGFFRMFLRDLNYTHFLLPIVICCFSFILDYACQLQTEADTTL